MSADRIAILAVYGVLLVAFVVQGLDLRRKRLPEVGTPPIPLPWLKLGKLCMVFSWLAGLLAACGIGWRAWVLPPELAWTAAGLHLLGIAFVVASFLAMGDANRVGLPDEATSLRSRGVYRVSRNPMYVGFLALAAAGALYAANPVVPVLAGVAILVHVRIVRAEERFLAGRFGDAWTAYAKQVRRWL